MRTEHFDVHYPAELEAWTRDVVSRLEGDARRGGGDGRGARRRGGSPSSSTTRRARRTGARSRCCARRTSCSIPPRPRPRSRWGTPRSFAEQLARPRVRPHRPPHPPQPQPAAAGCVRPGPARRGAAGTEAPRWVKEGYATYVEGRLTGSGRPYGVGARGGAAAVGAGGPAARVRPAGRGDRRVPGGGDGVPGRLRVPGVAGRRARRREPGAAVAPDGRAAGALLRRGVRGRVRRHAAGAVRPFHGGRHGPRAGGAAPAGGGGAGGRRHGAAPVVGHRRPRRLARRASTWRSTLRGSRRRSRRVVVWRTAESAPTRGRGRAPPAAAARPARRARRPPAPAPARRRWPRSFPRTGCAYDEPALSPRRRRRCWSLRAAPIGGGATRQDLFVWNWRRQHPAPRHPRRQHPRRRSRRRTGAAPWRCSAATGFCGLVMVDLRDGALTPLAAGDAGRGLRPPALFPRRRAHRRGHAGGRALAAGGRRHRRRPACASSTTTRGGARTIRSWTADGRR